MHRRTRLLHFSTKVSERETIFEADQDYLQCHDTIQTDWHAFVELSRVDIRKIGRCLTRVELAIGMKNGREMFRAIGTTPTANPNSRLLDINKRKTAFDVLKNL